jgi:hypothetical protein
LPIYKNTSCYKNTITDKKRLGLMKGKATIPDDFGEWTEVEAKLLGIIE